MNKPLVYLIDDEVEFTNLCKDFLKDDFFIQVFSNAGQALNAIKETNIKPHVIVSDMHMPEMNGLELAEAVKTESYNIPFIMMSGLACKQSALHAVDKNIYSFFEKPFSMSQLKSKVLEASKSQQQQTISVEHYNKLIESMLSLSEVYIQRYSLAEARLAELSSSHPHLQATDRLKEILEKQQILESLVNKNIHKIYKS